MTPGMSSGAGLEQRVLSFSGTTDAGLKYLEGLE